MRLIGVLGLLAATAAAQDVKTGSVSGKLQVRIEGVRLADVGPTVACLDAIEGKLAYEAPKERPTISQKDAKFSPDFLVVAAGQTVDMPNDDTIVHNVFSYSKPNDFDLGLYPKGESKSVTFRHPGVVKLYCSIHASMRAVLYVAPSPYFARVDAAGGFTIAGVPPGRYRVAVWNAKLPQASREIEVREGQAANVELTIEPRK